MQSFIQISLWVCLIFCVATKTSDVYCGDFEERSEFFLSQPTSSPHLHEHKAPHETTKLNRSSKTLLSLQQDAEMSDEADMLEKRTNFAKKAVKFFIQLPPAELSDNDFNPFAVHPDVVKRYCLAMYDDFLRETTDIVRTDPTLVLDRVHISYCHQLDSDFFQKDPRWQIWARRIVGVPGGFFASSAACALFMKFVADYFEIPTSEEASLGTVIFLCATTSPFIMMQLSESTNEFLNGIKRICSNQRELTGYYFKRGLSHKMMHALTHLLSLGKASIIAGVVYNIEHPFGGWAYPFAIGAFLSQYELMVRPEITTTDGHAQKYAAKKFSMLRGMLLKKLEKFETTINSSEESFQTAYSQIYPSGEVNYSRFAQFFLPIREIPLTSDHDEPSPVHVRRQAHFTTEASDFVQDLSSLKSFSFWDIPIEGCRFAIISFGNYGRLIIYGHFLTLLLPRPIAYTASTLITLMQWYSEDIIHQENSYDLSQRLSKFATNLRESPCRTMASTVCSAVRESPKIFPIVAVAALSSVVPAIGKDALTSQDPFTRKIIVVSTGLLDFSVLTSLIKRTAIATKAKASSIVMGAFGKCFERVARRLEHHTKKTQLQADIVKARKAIGSKYNNQTIEVISTLVRKEEGRGS